MDAGAERVKKKIVAFPRFSLLDGPKSHWETENPVSLLDYLKIDTIDLRATAFMHADQHA